MTDDAVNRPKDLRLSVRMSSNLAPEVILGCTKEAQAAGVDRCWFAGNPYERPALITVAAASQVVDGMPLGAGTVNVLALHPVMLAEDACTIAGYCEGRFSLGLGVGLDKQRAALGLPKRSQLQAMKETVAVVRALCAGEEVHVGEADAPPVRLSLPPQDVPILIGAVGPKFLELAGRIADGVIFSMGCDHGYLRQAVAIVGDGRRAADNRRPFNHVAYVIYGGRNVDASAEAGLKRMVAHLAVYIGGSLPHVTAVQRLAQIARMVETGTAAEDAVPDDILDQTTITGDARRVAEQLRAYLELGVDEVAFGVGDWLPDPIAAVGEIADVVRAWHSEHA